MSKLAFLVFGFILLVSVAADTPDSKNLLYWEDEGLSYSGTNSFTLEGENLKFGTQYLKLEVKPTNTLSQELTSDASKATRFRYSKPIWSSKGTWYVYIVDPALTYEPEFDFYGDSGRVRNFGQYALEKPSTSYFKLYWKNGLALGSGNQLFLDSNRKLKVEDDEYLKLDFVNNKFEQKLVSEADATVFNTSSGNWLFTASGKDYNITNTSGASIPAIMIGTKTVTLNAYVAPPTPTLYWSNGLTFTKSSDSISSTGTFKVGSQYVKLELVSGKFEQTLVNNASDATQFTAKPGKWVFTHNAANYKILNTGTLTINDSSNTNVPLNAYVAPPTPTLYWSNGLTFTKSSHYISSTGIFKIGSEYVKLELVSGKFEQKLVNNASDATQFTAKPAEWTFTVGGKDYKILNTGTLTINDSNNVNVPLNAYVVPTPPPNPSGLPNLFWDNGLTFVSGTNLTINNGKIVTPDGYIKLELNGTTFDQILVSEPDATNFSIASVIWTFASGSNTYSIINDGSNNVIIQGLAANFTLNAYIPSPGLYWKDGLTLDPTGAVAKFNFATGKVCINDSACVTLETNNTEISTILKPIADATTFTQIPRTDKWEFEIQASKFTAKINGTDPNIIGIFDDTDTEIPISPYSSSGSIVTPLFFTMFITLSVAIFAL